MATHVCTIVGSDGFCHSDISNVMCKMPTFLDKILLKEMTFIRSLSKPVINLH